MGLGLRTMVRVLGASSADIIARASAESAAAFIPEPVPVSNCRARKGVVAARECKRRVRGRQQDRTARRSRVTPTRARGSADGGGSVTRERYLDQKVCPPLALRLGGGFIEGARRGGRALAASRLGALAAVLEPDLDLSGADLEACRQLLAELAAGALLESEDTLEQHGVLAERGRRGGGPWELGREARL